jgi:hypothetical protein
MEVRLASYFPNWWNFAAWKAFRDWYAVTTPTRENGFKERCAAGLTRAYMYHTFVRADQALAANIQNDLDRFHIYLAESSAP